MSVLQDLGAATDADSGLGLLAAPAWMVAVLGTSIVLSGVGYFLWRVRRRGPTATWPTSSKGR